MKKVILLVLSMAFLILSMSSFTACYEDPKSVSAEISPDPDTIDDSTIVGKWKDAYGSSVTLQFLEDGRLFWYKSSTTYSCTYKISEDKITVTFSNVSASQETVEKYTYSQKDGVLTLIDEDDNVQKFVRV